MNIVEIVSKIKALTGNDHCFQVVKAMNEEMITLYDKKDMDVVVPLLRSEEAIGSKYIYRVSMT